MHALKIDTDGTITDLDLPSGGKDYMPSIQDATGGWVEYHTIGPDVLLWLDEDAPAKGAELNWLVHFLLNTEFEMRLNGVPSGPVVITGGVSGRVRELAQGSVDVVRKRIARMTTPASEPRPESGPHPNYVRDKRGNRYPGQLRPENLVWEQHNGVWIAFYSGEDIGAYRRTDIGYETRLGAWAPVEVRDNYTEDPNTHTEAGAAAEILWEFNLYLRYQVADES